MIDFYEGLKEYIVTKTFMRTQMRITIND